MRSTNRKGSGLIGLAVAIGLAALSVQAMARDRYEEKFEKTEALARDGRVYLNNISGDIEIKSWDKDEVRIEAVKSSEASSEAKAKEKIGLVAIEVTKEGDSLRIIAKYPQERKFWGGDSINVSVDFKLWIPAKASMEVKSVSGDVEFAAIGGSAKAGCVSGNVTLRKGANGADLNTVSGEVVANDIVGNVELKTVSGNIEITGVKGSVEAETVSGGIELSGVSGASFVNAKTLSGDVVYKGRIEPRGTYRFKSHSGDVKLTLPADSAFEFDAETFSGTIDSDFEIQVQGKMSPREVHGIVNKGGAEVKLGSFSGSIDLKKS
jgi:DUF4097 and DUF4098 domain-containing protein YvlB